MTLIGRSQLYVHGRLCALRAPPRTWPLLARLLLARGEPLERKRLAAELWPDEIDADGRAHLRRHLLYLDRALADAHAEALLPERGERSLTIPLRSSIDVDYWRLHGARSDEEIELALGFCSGDLLEEYEDDWLAAFRDDVRRKRDAFLEHIVDVYQRRGDRERSLQWAQTALRLDPLNEQHVRRVMLFQARAGNRSAALVAFRAFDAMLERELGVRPEPATLSLAAALRDLRDIEAPWSAHDVLPNNLPASIVPLTGRDDDAASVIRELQHARLVSLIGMPGVGKTSLARVVGSTMLPQWPDGVWFVDLGPLADGRMAAIAIARALGVGESAATSPLEATAARLRDRRTLLILDNCEHVLQDVAAVTDALLAGCASLGILVTSRERLGTTGESVYALEPLALPPLDTRLDERTLAPETVLASPAAALFLRRYAGLSRDAQSVRANLLDVAKLCHLADGIPLAIELIAAAAQRSELGIVRDSLERNIVLRAESSAAGARWRTMHDALDWSHRLLDRSHRAALVSLSVFANSFSASAAARFLDDEPDEADTVGILANLARKSLLETDDSESQRRYRLPAPVRDHALQVLENGGEALHWRRRHAAFFAAFAERCEEEFGTLPTSAWLARLDRTIDEIENVLNASLRARRLSVVFGARLVGAMRGFWYAREPLRGLEWTDLALRYADEIEPLLRARALTTRSGLLGALGRSAEALESAQSAIALLETLDAPRPLGIALRDYGDALYGTAHAEQADAAYARAAELFEALGDSARLASTLAQRATACYGTGDVTSARVFFRLALERASAIGEARTESSCYANLAELEFGIGNVDEAVAFVDRAIEMYRTLLLEIPLAITLMNRSEYQLALGDVAASRQDLRESLEVFVRRGRSAWLALAVQQAATMALHLGDRPGAARLLGYADARLRELGIAREPVGERAYRQLLGALGLDARASEYRAAYDAGATEAEAAIVAQAAAL